jgi:hypothetical protein
MIKLNRRNFLYMSWVVASAVGTTGCLDPVKALIKKARGGREPSSRERLTTRSRLL